MSAGEKTTTILTSASSSAFFVLGLFDSSHLLFAAVGCAVWNFFWCFGYCHIQVQSNMILSIPSVQRICFLFNVWNFKLCCTLHCFVHIFSSLHICRWCWPLPGPTSTILFGIFMHKMWRCSREEASLVQGPPTPSLLFAAYAVLWLLYTINFSMNWSSLQQRVKQLGWRSTPPNLRP